MTSHPGLEQQVDHAPAKAADDYIRVDALRVTYGGSEAVRSVAFSARRGEFVSLIGPSGCGKSTVLKAIGGLLSAASGDIVVAGQPIRGPRPREIAFVFQDLALYPWRSALRNVEIALQFAGVGRRERRERATEALNRVGLGENLHQFPSQLSGGMQQRVAIARALASDAEVLLLDEPFSALDEQTRLRLGGQLLGLLEDYGKTVIFVTHSLSEAAFLSDQIVVMGASPAAVKEIIRVPLDRPRQAAVMREPAFHELTDRLSRLLIEEPR